MLLALFLESIYIGYINHLPHSIYVMSLVNALTIINIEAI